MYDRFLRPLMCSDFHLVAGTVHGGRTGGVLRSLCLAWSYKMVLRLFSTVDWPRTSDTLGACLSTTAILSLHQVTWLATGALSENRSCSRAMVKWVGGHRTHAACGCRRRWGRAPRRCRGARARRRRRAGCRASRARPATRPGSCRRRSSAPTDSALTMISGSLKRTKFSSIFS